MPEHLASWTILVVDDQPGIRRLARQVLGSAGYRVIEAGNGSEALDLLKRVGGVDLVLIDVVMPYLDGVECARRLRERYPTQRLLCMSGKPLEVLARFNVADLGLPFLAKPFTAEELLAKIEEVMQRPARSGDRERVR